ncbi:MAG: cbb3-type cytochrome c oxidase N-terminal domain-containing protein [Bacteroidota bacterium]
MTTFNYKKSTLIVLALYLPFVMMAADNGTTAAASPFDIDINIILMSIAVLLLLPFYYTSKTFLFAAKDFFKKKMKGNESTKTIISILLLCFLTTVASAQNMATDATASKPDFLSSPKNFLTILLLATIFLEFLFIIYFSWKTTKFLNPETAVEASPEVETETTFETFWNKINNFKSKGEEDTIDTGHNYDGIRELDNVTPPWFITAFALSIIFAAVYLYRYHIAESAPLQIEEYNIEMANADAEKAKLNPANEKIITAETVTMLGAADIAKGKMLFTANCVSCHGANAASMPGGVGPNLTDEYWIHGGSIANVFSSITNGWPEKGMISWKSQLSSMQIAQIASYVKSTKGTVKAGGKESQGEIYLETAPVINDSTTIKTDSTITKTDSTSKAK